MVVFLCSDLARFVTGQNIVVDGGLTLHGSGVDGILRPRLPGEEAAPPVEPAASRVRPVQAFGSNERSIHHGRHRLESDIVDRLPHELAEVVEAVEHGEGGQAGGIGVE